jgi:uncharacterized membrane protein
MSKRDVPSQPSSLSPDGNWFWDGSSWITTLHPSGHWRWTGSRWEPSAQPVDRGVSMTIISAGAGCLTFAILFFVVLFSFLGLGQLLQRGGGDEITAWTAVATLGVVATGLLAALGVCLALLNRRWWLKGPLIAGWPLYLWILTLAAITFASKPAPSSILKPELYYNVSGDYLALLGVIGTVFSVIAIILGAAFLARRSGWPTAQISGISPSSRQSYLPDAAGSSQPPLESLSPTRQPRRGLWVALATVVAMVFVVSAIAVANLGNRLNTSAPVTSGGTCAPQPCANDGDGWIVSVSNVRYDMQSGNEFEKPQAGNVYVAVDVIFTNRLKEARQADPVDFVLIDGSGSEQPITFVDTCTEWNPENVKAGASFGPKCLVFEAAAGKTSGLVLIWTPTTGSGAYKIKVS